MDNELMYELVVDAVRQAMREEQGGDDVPIARRMLGGRVTFVDNEGKIFKELEAAVFFKKVTAVREKLRVLEQKVNNTEGIGPAERAEMQGYITRCYGTLTTFNFLFREEADKMKGTGD